MSAQISKFGDRNFRRHAYICRFSRADGLYPVYITRVEWIRPLVDDERTVTLQWVVDLRPVPTTDKREFINF